MINLLSWLSQKEKVGQINLNGNNKMIAEKCASHFVMTDSFSSINNYILRPYRVVIVGK